MFNQINSNSIRITLAQLNPIVGGIDKNTQQILYAIEQAYQDNADIIITPELALCGYPPEDLLFRPYFKQQCNTALNSLIQSTLNKPALYAVIGHPVWDDKDINAVYNAASVIHQGVIIGTYYKNNLPNQGVFDEYRYFKAGFKSFVFKVKGVSFGINICEDAWHETAPLMAKNAQAQALLVLNASPFYAGKLSHRHAIAKQYVCDLGLSYIGVYQVGGQDELIFDGGSFILNETGDVVEQLPQFETLIKTVLVSFNENKNTNYISNISYSNYFNTLKNNPIEAELYSALVLAMCDYVQKNGFKHVVLGLSGGVDSALVLALAVDALGNDNVKAVMMPTRFTASMSLEDSESITKRLNVPYEIIPIEPLFETYINTLQQHTKAFKNKSEGGVAQENLQARIRGVLLMAISNQTGALVLTTGNKSELAVGYCTLYGDMCGGFSPIKDVLKTMVYRLCQWRNQHAIHQGEAHVIPINILTRPPSAELRDNQTDQDSLPDYAILDAIIEAHVNNHLSLTEIVQELNIDEAIVKKILRLIQINEYKRRQSAIGPKITQRAFGKDWRLPISNQL